MPRRLRITLPWLLLALAGLLPDGAEAAGRYHVTDLSDRVALDLNDRGQVLFGLGIYDDRRTYGIFDSRGTTNGTTTLLELPRDGRGAAGYLARSLSADGRVVAGTTSDSLHPFVIRDGALREFTVPGAQSVSIHGVNSRGEVVGESYTGSPLSWPMFVYRDGQLTDHGTLDGVQVNSRGITEAGQVFGGVIYQDSPTEFHGHGFVLNPDGSRIDIDPLDARYASAKAMNDNGQVVGVREYMDGRFSQAFLFDQGSVRDLTMDGEKVYSADDINNAGDILAQTSKGAALYHDGRWELLNDLISEEQGWSLFEATKISDLGQIIGRGIYRKGDSVHTSTFLLTPAGLTAPITPAPVPEPASVAVFALVAAAIVAARSARRGGDGPAA